MIDGLYFNVIFFFNENVIDKENIFLFIII